MRFTLKDNQLLFGNHILGPDSALYADANEGLSGDGVLGSKQTPHRIDYLFISLGRVVGVESKTLNDLISSWIGGRLQRQLRTLFETVDVPVLMLRGVGGLRPHKMLEGFPGLMDDLLKFQMLGTSTTSGYVHFASRHDTMGALNNLKKIFDGEKNLRTAVSRYEKKSASGTKREQALQIAIKGCGPAMAVKLSRVGSLRDVLNATEGQLKKAGANRTVRASVRSLRR